MEKKWAYQVANEMPKLTEDEVAEMANQLGLRGDDEEPTALEKEKEGDSSD